MSKVVLPMSQEQRVWSRGAFQDTVARIIANGHMASSRCRCDVLRQDARKRTHLWAQISSRRVGQVKPNRSGELLGENRSDGAGCNVGFA